jgi:uncharacterized coiled-coil DUF342 family protein
MEWIIALLGVGCLFFAFQISMDYIKYKRAIQPRIQRLEAVKRELSQRIEAFRNELDESRRELPPIREEVDRLEQEYLDLQRQIDEERGKLGSPESS